MRNSCLCLILLVCFSLVTRNILRTSLRRRSEQEGRNIFDVDAEVVAAAIESERDPAPQDPAGAWRQLRANNPGWARWIAAAQALSPTDLLQLGTNCSHQARCRVAVCTALYLEEPYLEEWLKYLLVVGVDHVFVMLLTTLHWASRRSQNETLKVLAPFLGSGFVTVHEVRTAYDVPRLFDQIDAIGLCFKKNAGSTDWFLTSDPDEFYFSMEYPSLQHLAKHGEQLGVDTIPIPWYMFGSSGHMTKPKKLTFEAYTRRAKALVYDGQSNAFWRRHNGKVLFRAKCYAAFPNTHFVKLQPDCRVSNWTHSEYHLKHYQTKSWEDFLYKRKGNGFTGFRSEGSRPYWNHLSRSWKKEFLEADTMFNETTDLDMLAYSPIMRRLMANSTPGWWEHQRDWFLESDVGVGGRGRGKGPGRH